ncbi:hypothetical protein ACF06P_38545 [Streptomyces sp. NPDC015684]|uniref:hypothetical protein n=1 Tax=Streptomyces sp. NPDC015684 TaxID=3364963 RepID=UPI0036FFD41A
MAGKGMSTARYDGRVERVARPAAAEPAGIGRVWRLSEARLELAAAGVSAPAPIRVRPAAADPHQDPKSPE